MRTRIITAIVALPFLILPIYFGGIFLYFMMLLLSTVGLFELLHAYQITDKGLFSIALFANIGYYILIWMNADFYFGFLFALYLLIILVYFVIAFPRIQFENIAVLYIGFFYITYLISHILLIRQNESYGFFLVWLVFLISFGSDTFAYFIGRAFGKHKLAKVLSPNKTIEGSVGGILGAMLLTGIYGYIMYKNGIIDDLSFIKWLILLGGIGSVLSQLGDLIASAIKRQTDIKDFGKLLPGHGGILDRFDSNFLTAPFVYYIMVLLLKG